MRQSKAIEPISGLLQVLHTCERSSHTTKKTRKTATRSSSDRTLTIQQLQQVFRKAVGVHNLALLRPKQRWRTLSAGMRPLPKGRRHCHQQQAGGVNRMVQSAPRSLAAVGDGGFRARCV